MSEERKVPGPRSPARGFSLSFFERVADYDLIKGTEEEPSWPKTVGRGPETGDEL
jgi:hypothetical protein